MSVPGTTVTTSITGLLVRALVLVVLVPFLPLAYTTLDRYRSDVSLVEAQIQVANQQVALLANHYLESFARALPAEVAVAARDQSLPPASSVIAWERVDAAGMVVSSQVSATRPGHPCGYDRFLADLIEQRPVLSRVERWIAGSAPTILVGARVGEPTRGATYLIGVLRPEGLHRELTARLGAQFDRRVYAVDRAGKLIFYSDLDLSRRGRDLRRNPPVSRFLEGGSGPLRYVSTVTGKPRLGFVSRIDSVGWGVVVSDDVGTHLLGLRARYLGLVWSILFALVAASFIVLWASRRLALPVLAIRDALGPKLRTSHAPLAVAPEVMAVAEYAELVRAFDALSERLAETERELIQAEKSALLGQLAAGLAHQAGTPLSVMSGWAQVLKQRLVDDAEARAILDKIVRQTERLAEMIRRVLDLARPAPADLADVDLREIITQVVDLVGSTLKGLPVDVDVHPKTPKVRGNAPLLEHALMNLIVNAAHACEGRPEARIRITAGLAVSQPGPARAYCRVADDGCGIPQENLDKIFQPFFTTKPPGRGTGLGLAIVDRIVRQHGGEIEVRSSPGEGTTFTVSLPVAKH